MLQRHFHAARNSLTERTHICHCFTFCSRWADGSRSHRHAPQEHTNAGHDDIRERQWNHAFPGETHQDFLETYRFVNELDISYLHVFTYSPRPGTPAAAMPRQVSPRIVGERHRILRDLSAAKHRAFMLSFIGKSLDAITLHSPDVGDSGSGETDAGVTFKALGAIRAGLAPIICLGESLEEREAGRTLEVVARQLAASVPEAAAKARFVVAYEPIWAIGTGLTPTLPQVGEVHAALRGGLRQRFGAAGEATQLLYGGSVKPENARDLMHVGDVDGALVGGSSLKSKDFLAIAHACS